MPVWWCENKIKITQILMKIKIIKPKIYKTKKENGNHTRHQKEIQE